MVASRKYEVRHAEFDRFELLLMTGVVVSREEIRRRKKTSALWVGPRLRRLKRHGRCREQLAEKMKERVKVQEENLNESDDGIDK
jgi:hypothetical protein